MDFTMSLFLSVLQVATALVTLIGKSHGDDNFLSITPESCACPGDELIFECTIEGDAGTYWQGTALEECLQGRILIRHSQFRSGGLISRNICGASGSVIVRTILAVNNTLFTTQLTTFANQQLNGRTIECISDRGRIIGRSHIRLKIAPRINSLNFNLTGRQQKLIFTWIHALESCPATNYNIISRNCGDCPGRVNSSFATCNNFFATQLHGSTCTFTVQSVVCGNLLGEAADPIAVLLSGPSIPQITHIDVLHNRSVHTFFKTAESHSQCPIGRSPAVSYTIKYFDPHNNLSCGLDTIANSACNNQICNSVFDLDTLCSNSTHVSVTVLGTDEHGNEQESESFLVALQSDYMHHNNNIILENNTTKNTIIIAGSILGGIIFLLLLAIIILPPIIFTYRKFRSLRLKPQNIGINFEEALPANGMNSGIENLSVLNNLASDARAHEEKICGNVMELVTLNAPNGIDIINDSGESDEEDEEDHHKTELETVVYENNFHDIDNLVNLDNILIQIRQQVTPKWYQFGLAVGINKETLDEFSNFPPEECVVEMLDLWLRTSERAITWRDVADALKQIGLYQLAERTLKAYKTGKLQTGLGTPQSFPQLNILHPYESVCMEQLALKAPNNGNNDEPIAIPPLPPMTYQCTSELH